MPYRTPRLATVLSGFPEFRISPPITLDRATPSANPVVMKILAVVVFIWLSCRAVRCSNESCFDAVVVACSRSTEEQPRSGLCNSVYGKASHTERELQAYINEHLNKSYEYLFMAAQFNSIQRNRPGLRKLYKKLSDRTFEDAVDLIQQLTRRGGRVDFQMHEPKDRKMILEMDELPSLAWALDNEKMLAQRAIEIHQRARDPEIEEFIETRFLTPHARSIRKLTSHVNDLASLSFQRDPSLQIHMFDEYLQKTA